MNSSAMQDERQRTQFLLCAMMTAVGVVLGMLTPMIIGARFTQEPSAHPWWTNGYAWLWYRATFWPWNLLASAVLLFSMIAMKFRFRWSWGIAAAWGGILGESIVRLIKHP